MGTRPEERESAAGAKSKARRPFRALASTTSTYICLESARLLKYSTRAPYRLGPLPFLVPPFHPSLPRHLVAHWLSFKAANPSSVHRVHRSDLLGRSTIYQATFHFSEDAVGRHSEADRRPLPCLLFLAGRVASRCVVVLLQGTLPAAALVTAADLHTHTPSPRTILAMPGLEA